MTANQAAEIGVPLAAFAAWRDGGAENPGGPHAHVVFTVQGMRCASCSRAVETAVKALPGIERASVSTATGRATVCWNPSQTTLKAIIAAVVALGFAPLPLGGEREVREHRLERHTMLKRLGVAGLGMMQTMMVIDGLYASGNHGVSVNIAQFLRLVAMLIATPVFLYAGAPFLRGAWNDLRRHTLGMDVPVAIALILSFGASVLNTLRGAGQTYFDSVTMFIFFLLSARFIELTVRQRSLTAGEALTRSLPGSVVRIRADGSRERIRAADAAVGDRLSIPKGAVVPVDAELISSRAVLDESLVTGESATVSRIAGDPLLGGCVNLGEAIEVIARSALRDSTLVSIVALLERARAQRPPQATLAERYAHYVVAATLVLAIAVAVAWSIVDAERAFAATLAVLVVTCPCALSLAVPAAAAAATTRLARRGLLIIRPDALERLAYVDAVVIDKTGTLTRREANARVLEVRSDLTGARVLAMAAALEQFSNHPLAAAFSHCADPEVRAEEVSEQAGSGLQGRIAGEVWRLGRWEFVAALASCSQARPPANAAAPTDTILYLGTTAGIAAQFAVADSLSEGARELVQQLKRLGVSVAVASGDRETTVTAVAGRLGIPDSRADLSPKEKLRFVEERQTRGAHVLMVGDGINDGPVLAAASVSCAMGRGSAIAHAAADLLLLNESLLPLADGIGTARRAARVAHQNLLWAFLYNLIAVPAAALGWLPPWAAALGMSMSSLVVVLNATRLVGMPRVAWRSSARAPHPRSRELGALP